MRVGDRRQVTARGLGSGFLISKDGKIMTAAHIVQTAFDVEVVFTNGESVPAKVVASESASGVALLTVLRAGVVRDLMETYNR